MTYLAHYSNIERNHSDVLAMRERLADLPTGDNLVCKGQDRIRGLGRCGRGAGEKSGWGVAVRNEVGDERLGLLERFDNLLNYVAP